MDGEASPGDATVGMVSVAKCLLEEWASPQNLGKMGVLEAVESAPCKIRDSELSGHEVAGKVGWLFLAALESVTNERNALQWQVSRKMSCGVV